MDDTTNKSLNYVTHEVRALIGVKSDWMEASQPVDESEIRRFVHATMDPHPRYSDKAFSIQSRYGTLVAPPAFPMHAFRRAIDDRLDPFDAMTDPDFDGRSRQVRVGLPRMPIPLSSLLNGGYEYVLYSYAAIGDRIVRRSMYRDVYQREGRKGTMVFVLIEDEYATTDGRPLLDAINVQIMR